MKAGDVIMVYESPVCWNNLRELLLTSMKKDELTSKQIKRIVNNWIKEALNDDEMDPKGWFIRDYCKVSIDVFSKNAIEFYINKDDKELINETEYLIEELMEAWCK